MGAASLLFENEGALFAEFAGRDLKAKFPDIRYSNHAIDGATTHDLFSAVRQSDSAIR